jgi:hypothetical protein
VDGESRVIRLTHARETMLRGNIASPPQQRYQRPWDWERRSMCTSFGRGIPREPWRSKGYPFQTQFLLPGSG